MSKYISKDQNWANESTTYWFEFDGAEVGVVESGSETYPVDHNSQPIENENLEAQIMAACVVTDEMRAE